MRVRVLELTNGAPSPRHHGRHGWLDEQRLIRDFRKLQGDPPIGVSASPLPENVLQWSAVIFGPEKSIWEGGVFKLKLKFTEDYPNQAPEVRFVTQMYHPNIYADGAICLDILQNNWSPIYDVAAILTSIQSLLPDPNPNSPANKEAAALFTDDKDEYVERGRARTRARTRARARAHVSRPLSSLPLLCIC